MTLHEAYLLLGGDWEETLLRLGNRALLMNHLRRFQEDDAMRRLEEVVAAGNQEGIWRAAHALSGTCGTLGLNALAAAAERVGEASTRQERETALSLARREYELAVAVIGLMEERDTALAMLIHELRTPLQAILGTAEARRDAEGMGRIALAARHMAAMLTDVDDLTVEQPICRASFSLPEVLRDAAELARGAVGPDCPRIEVRAEPRHKRVMGDAAGLTQILLNLLTNAARHAPESDVILLRAARRNGDVELTVRDCGAGMCAKARQALQSDRQAGMEPGQGLGLTIVRGLVARMGGDIRLDSAPGAGTTVTVRLPMPPQNETVSGKTGEEPRRFPGLRALLAEDDRISAEVSTELLAGLGLHTVVTGDGGEAVQLARDGGFDCVFLDAHLPGTDLPSTLGDIRRALPDAPVFVLTGGVSRAEKDRLLSAGMRACLLKPVSAQQIARLLSDCFPDW